MSQQIVFVPFFSPLGWDMIKQNKTTVSHCVLSRVYVFVCPFHLCVCCAFISFDFFFFFKFPFIFLYICEVKMNIKIIGSYSIMIIVV